MVDLIMATIENLPDIGAGKKLVCGGCISWSAGKVGMVGEVDEDGRGAIVVEIMVVWEEKGLAVVG